MNKRLGSKWSEGRNEKTPDILTSVSRITCTATNEVGEVMFSLVLSVHGGRASLVPGFVLVHGPMPFLVRWGIQEVSILGVGYPGEAG